VTDAAAAHVLVSVFYKRLLDDDDAVVSTLNRENQTLVFCNTFALFCVYLVWMFPALSVSSRHGSSSSAGRGFTALKCRLQI